MILNEKAKDDFEKWVKNQNDLAIGVQIPNTIGGVVFHLNSNPEILPKRILNNLIIEWFDSVGIYINCKRIFHSDCLFESQIVIDTNKKFGGEDLGMFETRQEATAEAIKKANEIYNN